MLARVTTWEGGTADGLRAAAQQMQDNAPLGPPPGIKSNGITMLIDAEGGRALIVGLFKTEEDLRGSEPAMQAMNPPAGIGTRTAVDVYEVAVDLRA
jgi:hypothetical protein